MLLIVRMINKIIKIMKFALKNSGKIIIKDDKHMEENRFNIKKLKILFNIDYYTFILK